MIREPDFLLEDWPGILRQVAAVIDVAATAREHRAFLRPRKVLSAGDLLRLGLIYGGGLSLRTSCAVSDAAGIADITDPALFGRLENCGGWFEAIALALANASMPQLGGAFRGKRLKIVDTTSLCHPGARTASFRLHMRFNLAGMIDGMDFSDGSGAESLRRFVWEADDIVLADRGLAKALDLEEVAASGAGFVVRAGWNAFKWLDKSGQPADITKRLESFSDSTGEIALDIRPGGADGRKLPVRLIVRPLSAAQAEEARKKARKQARKNGKSIDPRTLVAAGFALIVTNLPESHSAEAIAAFYRQRWQIELLFKRLKSLSGLGQLPAKTPGLAKAWVFAKLIIAILAETAARKLADSSPSGPAHRLSRNAGLEACPLLPRPHPDRDPRNAKAHRRTSPQAAA